MPNIVPVSRQRHGRMRWQRFSSYSFAAQDAVTPLALAELPKAAMALPITFIQQNDRFVPAALMGFQAGLNLMVSASGHWLARYIPASYRSYPFKLVQATDGQQVLCTDEDSGLIAADISGEPVFDAQEQPSQAIKEVLTFLEQTSASRNAAIDTTQALRKHALIQPWPLTVRGAAGDSHIEGLYRIDEAALNALAADALLELRDAGALLMAYLQLLSMQHLDLLAELANKRNEEVVSARSDGIGLGGLGDTFSFGNLS